MTNDELDCTEGIEGLEEVRKFLEGDTNIVKNYHRIVNKPAREVCRLIGIDFNDYVIARLNQQDNKSTLDKVVESGKIRKDCKIKLYHYKGKIGRLSEFKRELSEDLYTELKLMEDNHYDKNNIDKVIERHNKEVQTRIEKLHNILRKIKEVTGVKGDISALNFYDSIKAKKFMLFIWEYKQKRLYMNLIDLCSLFYGGCPIIKLKVNPDSIININDALNDKRQEGVKSILETAWGLPIEILMTSSIFERGQVLRGLLDSKKLRYTDFISTEPHKLYFIDYNISSGLHFRRTAGYGNRVLCANINNVMDDSGISYDKHIEILEKLRDKLNRLDELSISNLNSILDLLNSMECLSHYDKAKLGFYIEKINKRIKHLECLKVQCYKDSIKGIDYRIGLNKSEEIILEIDEYVNKRRKSDKIREDKLKYRESIKKKLSETTKEFESGKIKRA